jgi:dienelactone hydrolase
VNPARPAPARRATRREFIRISAALAGGLVTAAALEPVAAGPGDSSPVAGGGGGQGDPSDVGSLYPFIRSQATDGLPALSYLNPRFRSLPRWRRAARRRLLELLHYDPPPVDPRPMMIERVDAGDHYREHIEFQTTPELRVPAHVLAPKGLKGRAPAIVALHDHGGFYLWGREKLLDLPGEHPALTDFKRQYYAGRSIATDLVRQGYVVLVIDMFYWGERRMLLDSDAADWRERPPTISRERISQFNSRAGESEQLVGRSIYTAGFTWPGVIFHDDMRAVDYLLTRPEVDPGRIGCVGLSVGGFRSCHLAALDDRVKAAVVVGWMTSFPWQLRRHIRWTIGHTMLVPGLYREMDYPDVASLAAPKPLLVINGRKDRLFHPDGVEAAFDRLRRCYAKAGAPERCQTRWYDTPHEFNTEMQAEAWAFLKSHV